MAISRVPINPISSPVSVGLGDLIYDTQTGLKPEQQFDDAESCRKLQLCSTNHAPRGDFFTSLKSCS